MKTRVTMNIPVISLRAKRLMAVLISGVLLSGCGVVVERYGAANIFGRTTSGNYDLEEPYQRGLMSCKTTLKPAKVDEVSGVAGTYFNTLSALFPTSDGWSYSTAVSKLSRRTIHVKTYDAQGTATRVGAEIHVLYKPRSGDPSTNIHWVQVLGTNHSLRPPSGHGNSATYVDIPGTATTPYYDDGYAADAGNCAAGCDFYDFPGRSDAGADHNWEATTFLVQGPAIGSGPGAITFLRPGFKWGWINDCKFIIDFPWLVYFLERPLVFALASDLEPGATASLRAEPADAMVLMKAENKVPVDIRSATLELKIEKQIDQEGYSPFRILRGQFEFGAYEFEDQAIGQSTGSIQNGSGYIHWETGEASLQFDIRIEPPGQEAIDMNFTGTVEVDREARTFTLLVDTTGIEQRNEK